jgi:hypothetical protein
MKKELFNLKKKEPYKLKLPSALNKNEIVKNVFIILLDEISIQRNVNVTRILSYPMVTQQQKTSNELNKGEIRN